MKTRIDFCLLFFVTIGASSQTKYAVEFVGGLNYGGPGGKPISNYSDGISGGVGVDMMSGGDVELVGTTLFTYFPLNDRTRRSSPIPYDIVLPFAAEDKAYSFEVLFGPRFHGHGSSLIHPFLIAQGGMHLLSGVVPEGTIALHQTTATQFLNIHGTEDVQLRGLLNIGVGLQIAPMPSIRINLQASYKFLIGGESGVETFIPVMVSVQMPV